MRQTLVYLLAAGAASGQAPVPPGSIGRAVERLTPKIGEEKLTCDLAPLPATLSYSLRYLAGYTATMRLSEFPGAGHTWTTLLRITPFLQDPIYLRRRVEVPEVPAGGKNAETAGGFFVGIGHYQVTAAVYDERGRVCRNDWEFDVKGDGDRAERSVMGPNTVAEMSLATLKRSAAGAAVVDRLTLLVNAAPLETRSIHVSAREAVTLSSAVAALLEKIPARGVRLVVFNMDQRKELFRSEDFQRADLDRVADAIRGVNLGLVDVHDLQNKTGDLDFLAGLINGELQAEKRSDLAIFLGPRARQENGVPDAALAGAGDSQPRFFFVELMRLRAPFAQRGVFPERMGIGRAGGRAAPLDPVAADPLPPMGSSVSDAISRAVSKVKGKTFRVTSAAEFAKALAKIAPPKPAQ